MYDAVVIGAGPNGLTAANVLVDRGWDVLVLEAESVVGGAVRSDSAVAEGFVHDTFSAFYPLAAASPVIRGLGLERHGLEWVNPPAPLGNPLPDGRWALVHRDPADTAAGLDELAPGDGEQWLALCRDWQRIGPALIAALLDPFPPVRRGAGLVARMAMPGGASFLDHVRRMISSVDWLSNQFSGEGPKLLFTCNAQHADLAPDAAGSGLFGLLLVMLAQHNGYVVPRGGAGRLASALADRFRAEGGTVRLDTRVSEVVVRDGRAVGVRTEDGEQIDVRRAVVADVTAPALYGGLVSWEHLPERLRRRMRDFTWDPATVKVDWALDGSVPWAQAPKVAPGCVHIAESTGEIAEYAGHLNAGLVPANPMLLTGLMTTTDPTRSPAGTESLWAYTHVPREIRGDAGPDGISGRWEDGDGERMADRMQQRIERFAPGFGSRIRARRVLTPPELQRLDANLDGGAVNGGTSALHQQLVFRPVPGLGRAETPVAGLYLGSASAHPGGGVHGACGSNAARAAIRHDQLRRLLSPRGPRSVARPGT